MHRAGKEMPAKNITSVYSQTEPVLKLPGGYPSVVVSWYVPAAGCIPGTPGGQ